jgi:autotransporter-associated beta strand protein
MKIFSLSNVAKPLTHGRNLVKLAVLLCVSHFSLSNALGQAGTVRTWGGTGGGTFSWSVGANWGGTVPGTNDSANLGVNIAGDTIITLDGNQTISALVIGDSTGPTFGFTINAGTSQPTSRLFINNASFSPQIQKTAGGTDTINAMVDLNGDITANLTTGTLIFAGGLEIGGPNGNEALTKIGNGTLSIAGPLTIANTSGLSSETGTSLLVTRGSLGISGANNTISKGVVLRSGLDGATITTGVINFGRTTAGTSTTVFSPGTGTLTVGAGTLNIGQNAATGVTPSTVITNASIDIDRITMTGGVLNLRNGNNVGTTTLNFGTTGMLTLGGGTTTFANTGGTAGGTVSLPAGARLTMNANSTLNFTSTANANYTFASVNSTSPTTVLRSQAGNSTFTLGGDGIDDVFNGQINLVSSGGNSRLIKIGTETFTIGGNRDNPAARLEVREGAVVLAKESSGPVHAIGGNMIVGNATATVGDKVVRIGGSFVGEGAGVPATFNDQIFRGSVVTLHGDGVLDLNGFIEGLDYLQGTGLVTNRAVGTSSTLIVGEANFGGAGRTFDGVIQDGTGQIGLIKTGDQTLSLSNGGSSYTGDTVVGRATMQLFNAGALTGTQLLRVERGGLMLLNNSAQTVQNRINDTANVRLDRGTLILRGSTTTNQTITERMGTLSLSSFNIVRTDTSGDGGSGFIAGSSLTMQFAGYNRLPGGQVAFVEQSNTGPAGFDSGSPAGSTSRIILDAMPTSFLVGGGGTNFDPNTSILLGAFGGLRGNASTDFMTVQQLGPSFYVRPLRASEMSTTFTGRLLDISNLPGGSSITWDDVIMLNGGTLRVNANTAFNAVRFNGATTVVIAEDRKWILGGMEANANLNTPTFDGSGMLAFATGAVNTFGGTISFGSREAILRVGGSTHAFRSRIEGTGGLSKSGGTRLDLMGANTYSGRTWLSEGELRAFTNDGFGAVGVGNEVINQISTVSLQSGINIGDGSLAGSKDLYLVGAGAVLSSIDQNNVWGGAIRVNPTNSGGQSGQNVTIRATGNSILTVKGMVTGAAANTELNLHEVNATQNFTGSGNGIILENNVGGTGGSIIFLKGGIADREGEAAAGTGVLPEVGVPARSAEHEKLNLFVRGFTGQASATNSDFVVSINDATKVNGRIDHRSGTLLIDSDYGTGGRGDYVRGALIRLSDGANVDRAGIMAGLLMTQGDTIFRGNDIQIGVNDGSHSSNSMALLGGLNRSGKVIIGSDRGTLDMNPIAGSSQFGVASTVAAGAGVTNLTLPAGSVRVGYGISGPGIAPGTLITAVNNNVITLSQATTAAADLGAGYTIGFFPSLSNVTGTTTNSVQNNSASTEITVSNPATFAVGRGISGPGIQANTTVTAINGNVLTLNNPTVGVGAVGSTYTAYNRSLGNTITLPSVAGLRVGMGIVGTGITNGTTIAGINGNVLTLSAPLSNAMPMGTSLSFPLSRAAYQTINTNGGSNGFNAVGSNRVRVFSANGLVTGTTVSGRGVPNGTTLTGIQFVSPGVWELTLSQNLIAVQDVANNSVAQNIGLTIQKAANFVETRMYAAPGGTVDLRMRVIDDGGFSLNNELGALTKVGRGTFELSGSAVGGSDIDGGINLFGGTLVFDYINLQVTEGQDINLVRDNSRVSQGNGNSPYQLTLGGGTLLFRDADAANINESLRGTLSIRAGNSTIRGEAGGNSFMTLNLGYHNPFLVTQGGYYWRAPDRFAGGTMQIEYANLEGIALGGASRVLYSQNAPSGGNSSGAFLGSGTVIPYSTLAFNDPGLGRVVDFASFNSEAIVNSNQTNTSFADASGFRRFGDLYDPSSVIGFFGDGPGDLSFWNEFVSNEAETLSFGYMTDDNVVQDFGVGFTGTLTANSGSNFFGARVIRYASNVQNNTFNIANGTRMVLSTRGDSLFGTKGDTVVDGGAILISNLVSRDMNNGGVANPTDQFMMGGQLSSAMPSTYFSQDVMVGPYSMQAKPAATSTDLIIHNYNDLGVFTIGSQIVNHGSLPLNLVVSGSGVTKLTPTTSNTFTGAVFINGGTLWVNSPVALGSSPTAMIYFNGGTLEVADLVEANRNSVGLTRTLTAGRPIVIGGNGATIKTTAPGTVVTYAGVIRAEDNIIPLNLSENQFQENIGVGDLIKTGAGRLIITNAKTVGTEGWNAYFGVTEIKEGTLQVNINAVNSGILGSHYSFLDGTRIEAAGRLDLQILGETQGTAEWFELLGGTLGTTPLHTDGVLDGMIRLTEDSVIDVTQGVLRFNVNAGTVDGAGKLTKTGQGMLMLYENSNHTGDIDIVSGSILGRSQGLPFGSGASITLGDTSASASGTAGIFLGSRTTEAIFRTTYSVPQNITVNAEGGVSQQVKYLGAINGVGLGAQNDTYLFSGNIGLFDDLVLSYTDEAANIHLNPASSTDGLRGGSRIIALRGDLTGVGNLSTEVIQLGGTVNSSDPDQIVTFELGGNNSGWTGNVRLGNPSLDSDRQHILRVTHGQGLGANNNVTLDFNSSFQVGGHALSIGNFDASLPVGSAVTNGVYVENAANGVGTLTVNQTEDRNWNAIFRNGVTPAIYGVFDAPIRDNVLNLVKTGSGVATMTQVNTYTGFTQVGTPNGPSGGTLRIAAGGSIAQTSALTVFAGQFELAGANLTLNQTVTLGGGAAGTKAVIETGTNTLTLGASGNVVYDATNNGSGAEIRGNVNLGSGTRSFTVADSIGAAIDLEVSAVLSGSAGLTKAGAGSMSLGGASVYTGLTTVSAGKLYAMNTTGSATGTGNVVVAPGATFGGMGTIAGDVTLNSGSLGNHALLDVGSPMISSGVELLQLSQTLTLGEFAIVDFYLGQTGFSKLDLNQIAVAPTVKFRINLEPGYVPTAGSSFDIMDWVGTVPSTFTNWQSILELPAGTSWVTTSFNSQGLIQVAGVAAPAQFLSQPVGLTVDPGQPATFSVSLAGAEPLLCQWTKDGVDILGATGRTFTINFALEADEGEYRVRVTNGVNTIVSDPAFLSVNDLPAIIAQPTGGEINPGENFSMVVIAAGATTFQWRRNNVPVATGVVNDTVAEGARSTLTITNANEANEGIYTVVVGNPAGSISSQPALLVVRDPVQITVQPVNQFVPQGTTIQFSVVATGHAPLTYQWRRGSTLVGTNSPVLSVTGGPATWGSYTVTVSNAFSNQVSNAVTLTEVNSEVAIAQNPVPQIAAVGSTVTLTCQAVGGLPIRYQWRRNGVNIAGATSPTLVLSNVTTARAGSYTCFVRNTLSTGSTTALSEAADVAIISTATRRVVQNEGTTAVLSLSSGGNVTLQWFYDDGDEEGEGPQPIAGATSNTLSLPNVTLATSGTYFCRATGTGGVLDGGANEVLVFNEPPEFVITNGTALPGTVVSEDYEFVVPMNPEKAKTATKFVATGLPPGLTINSTGVISGRATSTKFPVPYVINITASNARGAATVVNLSLEVKPLPGALVGTYTGPVVREMALNLNLGGRVDVTTTTRGTYTGRILLGTKTYSFRGVLNTDATNEDVATCTAQIKRGKLVPLVVSFTLDASTNLLTLGTVTDGVNTAIFNGWRSKWPKPVRGTPPPAAVVAGYYTVGLQFPGAGFIVNPEIPQGTGYATFTVNPNTARLNVAGRLADGTAFTSATFVGPTGQVLVFRSLYAANARGSVLGALNIQEQAINADNSVSGTLSWWRPATPATTARLYKDGFGPILIDSTGGRYDPPVPGTIVMGINPLLAPFNASVSFFEANVEAALPTPNSVQMIVGTNHRVIVDANNPRRITLRVTPRTGLFSGRFVLSAPHPDLVNGGKPATINRTVNYLGAIFKNGGVQEGLGYFLLPQLPATAANPANRTPIFSGQVSFQKLP